MNLISEARFNAIAGYARNPMTRAVFEELELYEEESACHVLGMIAQDREDAEYCGIIFAKDQHHRFRCVNLTDHCATVDQARTLLEQELSQASVAEPSTFFQGDENGNAIDFFTPVRERSVLDASFIQLSENRGFGAAKQIIELMMRWYDDVDGNFIEQFQTAGFDQRMWELYLYATFVEARYGVSDEFVAPDFCCSGLEGEFCVEAVTIGKSQGGGEEITAASLTTDEKIAEYLEHYMPIRFGTALTKKRKKKHHGQNYWNLPHVNGKPFALAVADFSSGLSMTMTRSALELYLFGYKHKEARNADGSLKIITERVQRHQWKKKKMPSGFFRQKETENIGAVIFNNSGTVAKFNRMGVYCGFGADDVLLIREGTMANNDPNASKPKYFRVVVNSDGYEESWIEGMDVYHNPNAIIPFPPELLPSASHHFLLEDGQVETRTSAEFHPFGSITKHMIGVDVQECLRKLDGKTHVVFTPKEGTEDAAS